MAMVISIILYDHIINNYVTIDNNYDKVIHIIMHHIIIYIMIG